MSFTFRASTFNMENLFSRTKALNLQDKNQTAAILDDVAKLEELLGKPAYAAADKAQILALTKAQSEYIEIREDRKKLFAGSGATRKVVAAGAKDWDGIVVFKPADIAEEARTSTADVVKALRANVLCVVEVENRPALQAFNSQSLGTKKFDYPIVVHGNDDRDINVGLLSRFEITNIRTHIFDCQGKKVIFSRDCAHDELKLPDGRPLHVLCNHLKSQGYGDPKESAAKRLLQTTRIAKILTSFNLATDLVIVAGDFNDDPTSPALQPLLSVTNLFDVLQLKFSNPADRWTYKYGSKMNQIDFVLVSKPLKDGFQDAGIERRGMYGVAGITPFPSAISASTAASDHAAIWAEFTV